jgi:hypothetical protein
MQQDLRELMIAPSYGAPTEAQTWGLTSQPHGGSDTGNPSVAQLELQADIARQIAASQALQSLNATQLPSQDLENEIGRWKKAYGDGENEKGELRRQLEETKAAQMAQTDLLNQILASASQQPAFNPSYNPQFPFPAPFQTPAIPAPYDPFQGKTEEELISVKDFRTVLSNELSPVLHAMQMQTMQMMDKQTAAAKRSASGITPLDEFQIARENPWVQGLQTETQRIDAVAALKKARATTTQQAQGVQAQTVQATAPILRRLTATEQVQSQTPDLTSDALTTAFQRDLAAANQLSDEHGKRAQAMRQIAAKYNIPVGKMSDMGLMRTQVIT